MDNNKLALNMIFFTMQFFMSSINYDFPIEFTIESPTILKETTTIQILDVKVQSNIRWNEQVNYMISRASKTCWVLRRMRALGVDKWTLVDYCIGRQMACIV